MPFNFREITDSLSPIIKKILKNTTWLLVEKVLRVSVGVVIVVWIARYLGPGQYGLLNYAIALVGLLSPISTLGLDNLVIRDLVKQKDKQNLTLGSAFALKLSGSVLTIIISYSVILILRPGDDITRILVLITAAGTIFQSLDVIDFFFQSQVLSKYSVIARNTAFLISSSARVLFIVFNMPVTAFAWANFIELAVTSVGFSIAFSRQGQSFMNWKVEISRITELLKESIPLAVAGAAIIIYMKIDILFIGNMRGEADAGIYAAAARISESFYFISLIITSSTFPILMENIEFFQERFRKITFVLVVISYLIIFPVVLLSPFITSIFGDKYAGADTILALHIWSTMFVFLSVLQTSWYIQNGKKGIYIQLRRTIAGAVINIVLNIILIPRYSGVGAAVATLISYSYVGLFSNLFHPMTKDIFRLQMKAIILAPLWQKQEK